MDQFQIRDQLRNLIFILNAKNFIPKNQFQNTFEEVTKFIFHNKFETLSIDAYRKVAFKLEEILNLNILLIQDQTYKEEAIEKIIILDNLSKKNQEWFLICKKKDYHHKLEQSIPLKESKHSQFKYQNENIDTTNLPSSFILNQLEKKKELDNLKERNQKNNQIQRHLFERFIDQILEQSVQSIKEKPRYLQSFEDLLSKDSNNSQNIYQRFFTNLYSIFSSDVMNQFTKIELINHKSNFKICLEIPQHYKETQQLVQHSNNNNFSEINKNHLQFQSCLIKEDKQKNMTMIKENNRYEQMEKKVDHMSKSTNLNAKNNHFSQLELKTGNYFEQQTLLSKNQSYKNLQTPYYYKLKGLPNLGQTCYINTSLQALRQILYKSPEIFNLSLFGIKLKRLFHLLDEGYQIEKTLAEIIEEMKQYQQHTPKGGDSYIQLLSFINEISKTIPNCHKNVFEDYFSLISIEGFQCQTCKNYDQDDQMFSINKNIGIELDSLNQLFDQTEEYKNISSNLEFRLCKTCAKRQIHYENILNQKFPNFLLVQVGRSNQNNMQINLKQEFYKFKQYSSKDVYKIIGFCRYFSSHYTYTALYENQWIEFSDKNLRIHQSEPITTDIYYLLLQKI